MDNLDWVVAYRNLKQFIKDCEVSLEIEISYHTKDEEDDTFTFILKSQYDTKHIVKIPYCDLEKIRYTVGDQNALESRQINVDGTPKYWWTALLTKDYILELLDKELDRLVKELEAYEETNS